MTLSFRITSGNTANNAHLRALPTSMLDQVTATPELLEEWIFDKGKAKVIFALEGKK